MTPNEQGKLTTTPRLSAFSTMALVVQLLRSVKERCAQEAQDEEPRDIPAPIDEAGQAKSGEQDGQNFLDRSDQSW